MCSFLETEDGRWCPSLVRLSSVSVYCPPGKKGSLHTGIYPQAYRIWFDFLVTCLQQGTISACSYPPACSNYIYSGTSLIRTTSI